MRDYWQYARWAEGFGLPVMSREEYENGLFDRAWRDAKDRIVEAETDKYRRSIQAVDKENDDGCA